MTPRPVIRWKSFWFGILVLGFLGWAWVRSYQAYDFLSWRIFSGASPLCFGQVAGDVAVGMGGPGFADSLAYVQLPIHGKPVETDPVWIIKTNSSSGVGMAHWVLILLFFVPWSAFLAWRWRRQRNLTT